MPGFDGTGPRGLGPLTGGGRGFCQVNNSQAQVQPTPVQPVSVPGAVPVYRGIGLGIGRCFRGGRGMGRMGRGMGRGRLFY